MDVPGLGNVSSNLSDEKGDDGKLGYEARSRMKLVDWDSDMNTGRQGIEPELEALVASEQAADMPLGTSRLMGSSA